MPQSNQNKDKSPEVAETTVAVVTYLHRLKHVLIKTTFKAVQHITDMQFDVVR